MEIEIELLNFNQYIVKTSGYNSLPWFSLSNDTLLHPDFFDITGEEFKAFIWIVSVATKVKSNVIRLSLDHACRTINIRKTDIFSALKKLEGKRTLILSRPSKGLDPALIGPSKGLYERTNERTNVYDQTKVLIESEFDLFYSRYPKKVGKQKGQRTFKAQIKTQNDLDQINTALENYIAHVKKSVTDVKYIKQFDTFMNSWRDWLDPDAGNVTIRVQQQNKKSSFTSPVEF